MNTACLLDECFYNLNGDLHITKLETMIHYIFFVQSLDLVWNMFRMCEQL